MAEELHKISDLEDAMQQARIEYSRKAGESVHTPDDYYPVLPLVLRGDIIIRLSRQQDNYSHAEIQTPEYDQVGFLDAIAKRVAEDMGVHLGKGIKNSAFFARHQQLTHYFFLEEKAPDRIVQAVHTINSANELYLKGVKNHDRFIRGFLRERSTNM